MQRKSPWQADPRGSCRVLENQAKQGLSRKERKLHFRTAETRRQAGRRSHPLSARRSPRRAESWAPSTRHPVLFFFHPRGSDPHPFTTPAPLLRDCLSRDLPSPERTGSKCGRLQRRPGKHKVLPSLSRSQRPVRSQCAAVSWPPPRDPQRGRAGSWGRGHGTPRALQSPLPEPLPPRQAEGRG